MKSKNVDEKFLGCLLCEYKFLISGNIVSRSEVSFQSTDPKIETVQPVELDRNAVVCPRCGFLHVFANMKEIKAKLQIKDN